MKDTNETGPGRPPISGPKKALLLVGLLIGCVGLAMSWFGGSGSDGTASDGSRTTSPVPPGGSSLLPGTPPGYPDTDDAPAESQDGSGGVAEWGPPVARFGFGFFVGFAIAYALRAFFKVTLIVLGGIFLLLFGLQYGGLIEVDWDALGRHYDSVADWFSRHAGSFKDFITGHLPTAGSALAGMFLGFRRR